MMINVSVIGVGVLGEALIVRLLNCGFKISAYNRTKEKLAKLVPKGVKCIDDLDKAFLHPNKIWILCLGDGKSILEVFSSESIVSALKRNRFLIINTSTIGPKSSDRLQCFFKDLNVEYVELPVSGGVEGALSGTLVGYVGRKPKYFKFAFDCILQALLKRHCLMGSNAAAQAMKIANNYCEAVNLIAAAEALLLAEQYGISREVIGRSLGIGRGRSVYLEIMLERYMSMNRHIAVPLEVRIKDLKLSGELFFDLKMQSVFYSGALEVYEETLKSSLSAQDQTDCFLYLSNRVNRGVR